MPKLLKKETSLRMQRKHKTGTITSGKPGNISAHAEKTLLVWLTLTPIEKHLCACRENFKHLLTIPSPRETSLRMQRKRYIGFGLSLLLGNISAHAEKTNWSWRFLGPYEKHLCACRENCGHIFLRLSGWETSLRMQRKQARVSRIHLDKRNISTHAEKTFFVCNCYGLLRKHLCACRENWWCKKGFGHSKETSLRMQRKQKISCLPWWN